MSSFVTFSLPDRQIRVFSFITGKLTRRYDESLGAIQDMQQAGTAIYRVEDMEFGRRLAVDRELELPGPDGKVPGRWINAVWDESGHFVIYPTLLGIKGVAEFHSVFGIAFSEEYDCSGEYRYKQGSAIAWEGRDRPIHES